MKQVSLGPRPPIVVHHCWDSEADSNRCPKPTLQTKGGSVMLAGVAVASSCQIVLPIFGVLFLVVGTVLTLASYRGPESDEDPEQYLERVHLTSNLRILGPCCLAMGTGMLLAGVGLCLLSRRAKKMRLAFRCPIHGDFYPISSQLNFLSLSKSSLGICSYRGSSDTLGLPTPQCPHSNRSSVSTGPISGSPLPPITSSTSFSGLMTPTFQVGDMTGSTQSLAVSYDVASFPHSREASPTRDISQRHNHE
ncbi:uncharacterized protein [Halyomorpha halys]|uniref:uncharacterized protein n=1 Tax=Halyomorpha halys TaxID=286706 RepID=UPI0006D519BE|nr:uncharacterized protein LOC106683599 [Halyomorpha halys]